MRSGWTAVAVAAGILLALPACGRDAEPGGGEVGGAAPTGSAQPPATVAEGNPGPAEPRLEEYPEPERFRGPPAPVDVDDHPRARRFAAALRRGAAEGPNFAGRYTVVTWPCGARCEEFMIVDARTGRVHDGRTTAVGVDFGLHSRLLVVNPPARAAAAGCPPGACTTQHLEWTGERLEPVLEPEQRAALERAVRDYVADQSGVTAFTVQMVAVADGHARVRVVPSPSVADPATVYLREEPGGWAGVAIGTDFAPDDLDRLRIPRSVRPGG